MAQRAALTFSFALSASAKSVYARSASVFATYARPSVKQGSVSFVDLLILFDSRKLASMDSMTLYSQLRPDLDVSDVPSGLLDTHRNGRFK